MHPDPYVENPIARNSVVRFKPLQQLIRAGRTGFDTLVMLSFYRK